jgi:tetratricopeptide (TPR) repeat protein
MSRDPEIPGGLAMELNEEAGEMLLHASLERGRQLLLGAPMLAPIATKEDVESFVLPLKKALEVWRNALRRAENNREPADCVRNAVEDASVHAANELLSVTEAWWSDKRWDDTLRLLNAAVDLLRETRDVVDSDRVRSTLVAVYSRRARCYERTPDTVGALDQAIQEYETALTICPDDAKLSVEAADAYNSRGCKTGSTPDFTRAIELDGQNALYHANRAAAHLRSGNPDEAIEDLRTACGLSPDDRYRKLLATALTARAVRLLNDAR